MFTGSSLLSSSSSICRPTTKNKTSIRDIVRNEPKSRLRSRVLSSQSFVHYRILFVLLAKKLQARSLYNSHLSHTHTLSRARAHTEQHSIMVLFDNQISEVDATQYYYGECDSLLATCCSKTRLTSPFKFRPMNRQRRQMAFEMLRQMKLQEQKTPLSNRSKRRRNKKRFYRTFCCTGKSRESSLIMILTPSSLDDFVVLRTTFFISFFSLLV